MPTGRERLYDTSYENSSPGHGRESHYLQASRIYFRLVSSYLLIVSSFFSFLPLQSIDRISLRAHCVFSDRSDQSNSSVEKAGLLGSVSMRMLPVDDKCSLRGEILKRAVEEDMEKGFIPFYVVTTLGTTGTCAFDNLDEIGPICKQYNMWLHTDAAYAGWCE